MPVEPPGQSHSAEESPEVTGPRGMRFRPQQAEHGAEIKDADGHGNQGPSDPSRHPPAGDEKSEQAKDDPAGPDMDRFPHAKNPSPEPAGQGGDKGDPDKKPPPAEGHQ